MISSMLQYIQKSPDCFHAVENLRQRLLSGRGVDPDPRREVFCH